MTSHRYPTQAQIAARELFADKAKTAQKELEEKEKAVHENRERLKAARLARHAVAERGPSS